jgi:hypothetical protein
VLLLVVCAVSAVVGTLLGQLFGLAGVGVTVVLIALIGLILNLRSRQRR